MTLQEAYRRIVRGHLVLILVCVLLPVLVAGAVTLRTTPVYQATGRIELAGGLATSNVQADAASQRLFGIVTSVRIVRRAMAIAKIDGDPQVFADEHVSVRRIGVSPVVEVTVTDPSRDKAAAAASAMIAAAMSYTNAGRTQSEAKQLADVNKAIALLNTTRNRLIAQLPTASPGRVLAIQAQISGLEPNLADQLRRRSDLLFQASTRTSAEVVDPVSVPSAPQSRRVAAKLALAGLVGLLLGLGLASLAEAWKSEPVASEAPEAAGGNRAPAERGSPATSQNSVGVTRELGVDHITGGRR